MTLLLTIATTLYLTGFYNCLLMSKKNIISFKRLTAKGIDLSKIPEPISFGTKNVEQEKVPPKTLGSN